MNIKKEKIIPSTRNFYMDSPKARVKELRFAIRVFREFIRAFRTFHFVDPCITVFGSARFKEGNPYYEAAMKFGEKIAELGFTTITGGGPGIMEAANRGAFNKKGISIGCNVKLPFEQKLNPWTNKSLTFDHFFIRKVIMVKYSYAFIILPGGFGTMDEFFETLTLVQTRTITKFPIVLYGVSYFQPLIAYLHLMAKQHTIAKEDLDLVLLTDDINQAMEHIRKYVLSNYQIRKKRKRLWWLFENN